MAEESNKLIKEVQSYVNRMVSDFSTRATRRTETAVAEFKSDTEVLESKTVSRCNGVVVALVVLVVTVVAAVSVVLPEK